jgi:predicted nucleotidyltransferase
MKHLQLYETLTEKLKTITEVKEIYTFGKILTGKTDQYSDVDIIIISDDLVSTLEKTDKLINEISSIEETYTLQSHENKIVQMYKLKDYLPYQKIDLSIECDVNEIIFEKKRIYQNERKLSIPKTTLPVLNTNTFKNHFNDLLFAIPRFLKSAHRKDISIYRRWNQTLNNFWFCLFRTYVAPKSFSTRKINPNEFERIFLIIPEELKIKIEEILPTNGHINIIEAYPKVISLMIQCYKNDVEYETVNDEFTETMINFMYNEIKLIVEDSY